MDLWRGVGHAYRVHAGIVEDVPGLEAAVFCRLADAGGVYCAFPAARSQHPVFTRFQALILTVGACSARQPLLHLRCFLHPVVAASYLWLARPHHLTHILPPLAPRLVYLPAS